MSARDFGQIGLDIRESVAIFERLVMLVDGTASSLLRLLDEIERLPEEECRYIVFLAAVERSASPDEAAA